MNCFTDKVWDPMTKNYDEQENNKLNVERVYQMTFFKSQSTKIFQGLK